MPDRSGWDRKPGFDLTGRRALVIGAETAAGAAVAGALAEAGAAVAVVAATGSAAAVSGPHTEAGAAGRPPFVDAWDVRDAQAVADGYARLVATFGAPTILVTAQDARQAAPIEQTGMDAYRQVMAVIADGTYYSSRAFLAALPAETAGARIISITTMFGERGIDALSAYAAAHGAVHNLVRALSQETGGRGVTVNAIATGWMTDTAGRGPDEIGENRLMRFVPMRRFGRPDEVAPLAVLLAGAAGGNISGQILHVDGGITTHL